MGYNVKVVAGGKIVLPAALRRKYGYAAGQTLVVEDFGGGLAIRSLDEVVARAQAIMARAAPAERRLSDELIAERRQAAADE